jgi:hypothetical protein
MADGMVDPASLRFSTNKFGKPKVIWPSQVEDNKSWRPHSLCFNLSHTQSLLACAVTINSEVSYYTYLCQFEVVIASSCWYGVLVNPYLEIDSRGSEFKLRILL